MSASHQSTYPHSTDSVYPQFLAAVRSGDDEQAERLVAQLTPADEPNLLALAAAGSVDARWWAVRSLALHGAVDAVGPLVAALQDGEAGVRAAAALALAQLHARLPAVAGPSLAALAPLLADDDGLVRQAAADALAQCGDAALPVLAAVLQGGVEAARVRAAYALRKIATYGAAAQLYPLLDDPNPLIRTYAHEGLDDLGLLENVLLLP
jgi:HEAT repeat protein